jgi:hypothetical protein
MKAITYTICHALSLSAIVVLYTLIYCLGTIALQVTNHVLAEQVSALLCLILGSYTWIKYVPGAQQWAKDTIVRQSGMPLSFAVRNPGRVLTDFLPGKQERLAQKATAHLEDLSNLFTGMDTTEIQVSQYSAQVEAAAFQNWCADTAYFAGIDEAHPYIEGLAIIIPAPNRETYYLGEELVHEYMTPAEKKALLS